MVTWPSCIASSSAAWVFGGVRLISSASTTLAKTGPRLSRKLPVSESKTFVPTTSAGIMSGLNWMRLKETSSARAALRASSVLAVPGTPSSRMCPPASRPTSRPWTASS